MSKGDTWMPLFIGDYLRDTGHLTGAEHGAYLLLLMQAWTRGGALPTDDERLRHLARMSRREWAKARDAVLAFFVIEDGAYRSRRLDRELARSARLTETKRQVGALGAAKRWKNNGPAIAEAMPERCQTDAPSPSQSQEEEEPPSQPSAVRSPRGSRLPAAWQPDAAMIAFAQQQNLDPQRVAAQFRDYWHAKAGKDAVKLDWPATWRGWCRREAERQGPRSPAAKPPSRWDAMRETFDDAGLFGSTETRQ